MGLSPAADVSAETAAAEESKWVQGICFAVGVDRDELAKRLGNSILNRETMAPLRAYEIREKLEMTQAEMAEYLGLKDRSQVCYLENGRTAITGITLLLLRALERKAKLPE